MTRTTSDHTRPTTRPDSTSGNVSRRRFLGSVGAMAVGTLAAQAMEGILGEGVRPARAASVASAPFRTRANAAYQVRLHAAQAQHVLPGPEHPQNQDETHHPTYLGNYHKALPHNAQGEVDGRAYQALLRAVASGKPADYEAIPLGGSVKLANPQGALAFALEGVDSHALTLPAAPAVASAETAGEMVELYWQALTRDIAFTDYDTAPLIAEACADLNTLRDFRGPTQGGQVTHATLFRGDTPGELHGPYLSQFLWLKIPYGAMTIEQKYRCPLPGDDYLHQATEWLAIQNGAVAATGNHIDPVPRYLRNGRDLGEWVHR